MRRSGGGWGLRRVISFKFRKNDTANYFVGFVFFPIQFIIFTLKSIFCNILNKTKKRGKKKTLRVVHTRAHSFHWMIKSVHGGKDMETKQCGFTINHTQSSERTQFVRNWFFLFFLEFQIAINKKTRPRRETKSKTSQLFLLQPLFVPLRMLIGQQLLGLLAEEFSSALFDLITFLYFFFIYIYFLNFIYTMSYASISTCKIKHHVHAIHCMYTEYLMLKTCT